MNILRKQFLAHVAQTSPSPMLVEVARAEGSFFYTPEGKRYYDLVAGVSVSNVGHANPAVVRAVQEQAARYMHVMVYGELVETPQVEYAARIASLLPDPLESVYFVNSGAEAVEGALRRLLGFGCRHPFPEPAEGMGSQMDAPCLQPLRQALEIGRLLEPVGGATAPVRDDFFYLSFHVI